MAGGKLPKTAEEKAVRGTLRPCRENRRLSRSSDENYQRTEQSPVGLTKDAREAWALAVRCAPKGQLLATDMSVLERWARNYALYRKIAKDVDHDGVMITITKPDGTEMPIENPLVKTLIRLQQVISVCEKELGFTPASRARVSVETSDEQVNDFDGF